MPKNTLNIVSFELCILIFNKVADELFEKHSRARIDEGILSRLVQSMGIEYKDFKKYIQLTTTEESKEINERHFYALNSAIPSIVLSTFIIELSLKYICYKNKGSFEQIHKLTELFNKLSATQKLEIKQSTVLKMRYMNCESFESCLSDVENYFVKLRYFFQNSDSIELYDEFIRSLKDTLIEYIESNYFSRESSK